VNIVIEIVARAHRLLGAGIVVLAVAGAVVLIAPAARADEFVVGIVVESVADSSADAAFIDGFRLAVDQSPDVSHPPNTEGGDHLGGMDVVLVVVDESSQGGALVGAVLEFVATNSVPILVADVAQDVLTSLVGPVSDRGTMVIAVADGGAGESETTPLLFVAGETDGAGLLTDRSPGFKDAFVAAYGRPASPAATRGYVAGRLVDISVEATDRDPWDSETLLVSLKGALGVSAAPDAVADSQAQIDVPESSGDGDLSVFAFAAAIGLMVAAGVHIYWAAGGTWPGADRSDLARKVVGSTDEFPSTALTLGVAVLLVAGGIVVGGATGVWTLPISDTLVTAASWVVAVVLVVRGLAGLILSG